MVDKKEMMTSWHGSGRPHIVTWSNRTASRLAGSAKGRRHVPGFRPFDLLSGPNQSLVLLENDDQQLGVQSFVGAERDFLRYVDFDAVYMQFSGTAEIETEYGFYTMAPGDMMLVPEGIAHRSTGSANAMRVFIKLHAPVSESYDESKETAHTEFEMVRHGGPDWRVPAERAEAPKGVVTERLSTWGEAPEDVTLIARDYEDLVGAATTSRRERQSGIKKFRMFDVFEYRTGVGAGPGPKVLESKHFLAEVYNTIGDQHTFHRGLRSEEISIQFRGNAINVSEFDAHLETPPGLAAIVPLGIAHRVQDCDEQFLRVVFYSDLRWRMPADLTQHVYDSRFEVRSKIVKPAAFEAAAE